jgi:hypothetical protein
MPTIRIPDPLRGYAGGAASFEVGGATVEEALADAFRLHPDLRSRIVDGQGRVHRHLLVFRNEAGLPREEIAGTTLAPGDAVTFLEAVGGGA